MRAVVAAALTLGFATAASAGSYATSDLGKFATVEDCVVAATAAFQSVATDAQSAPVVIEDRIVFQASVGPAALDALIVCTPAGEGSRAFLTVLSEGEAAADARDRLAEIFAD